MKVLDFDGEQGRERYEVLYDGLLNTSYSLSTPETRVHSRILGKLESIGVAAIRGNQATFTLAEVVPARVELDDAEYQLMQTCLNEVRWNSRASRIVPRVIDFFEEAGK